MDNQRFTELAGLADAVFFSLETGDNDRLREYRDAAFEKALSDRGKKELAYLDEMVIETVLTDDDLHPTLLDDHSGQAQNRWWWHLGAIRERKFPADALPPHLRKIYQSPVN